jgi:ATP-binding cassette subfamily B protein
MSTTNSKPDLSLMRLSRWVLQYAARRRGPLLAVLLSMLVRVGLDVLKPWPMVFLVDHVLQTKVMPPWLDWLVKMLPGPHNSAWLIGWSVIATVLLFLLSWAVGLSNAYANISLGQRMTYDLASDLFARLQQLSLRFHTSKSVGDNIRRVTADCTCVSTILKDALLPALSSLVSLLAMFTIMWRIDSSLTLLALVVVPYMMLIFQLYAQPMMERSYQQQEVEGQIYDVVEQTFSAMPVVQAFGREELNDARFRHSTRQTVAATVSLMNIQMQFKILIGLATSAGTAAILWFGTRHALQGLLTVGDILLFLSYLGLLYAPLEAVMYSSSTIQGAAGSARRVWEVLETEREVTDKPGAVALSSVRGHVQFENVTYGYEPERPVLRDVSIDVQPGETIALVGPTGAGKTTLLGLVPRFFDPWQGRVRLDGQDVREIRLKSLRGNVAIVLQEPFLFPLSIAENIAYGRPHATLAEIESAARAANAHEFIQRLPAGYQTVIGERGATLSGGERQRLSIARALLKDSPILILDEPTSALDAQTEHLLLEAVERLTKGRTTFIIAHRLSTIRRANRIVVLEQGQIVETGTHEQLLARAGIYARFHTRQNAPT